jgi:hypothetical protein
MKLVDICVGKLHFQITSFFGNSPSPKAKNYQKAIL